MSNFELSSTVDKDKVFLVNLSEIEGNLNPAYYISRDAEYIKIINNLKTVFLSTFCTKIMSGPFGSTLKSEHYGNGEIPFIRIKNIKNGKIDEEDLVYISEEDNDRIKNSELRSGDIVLSKIGTVGELAIIPPHFDKCNISENNIGIKVKPDTNSFFLRIVMETGFLKAQMNKNLSGNVQKFLNVDTVKKLKIPDIVKEKQSLIVKRYQELFQSKQQKETKAKKLLNGIDDYLLGELGITLPEKDNSLSNRIFTTSISKVSGNRFDCDYYSVFYSQLENAIDKSKYKTDKIDSVVTNIASGKTAASREYSDEPTGFPIIKVGSYTKEYIDLSKTDYTKSANNLKAQKGDIFILSAAHQAEYVGKHIKYLDSEPEIPTSYVGELICVRADKAKCNSMYLFSLLNIETFKTLINREKTGQTSHVYGKDIKHIKIPVPPIDKQNEIAEHIKQIREQAKQLQNEAVAEHENAKQEVEQMILGKENG